MGGHRDQVSKLFTGSAPAQKTHVFDLVIIINSAAPKGLSNECKNSDTSSQRALGKGSGKPESRINAKLAHMLRRGKNVVPILFRRRGIMSSRYSNPSLGALAAVALASATAPAHAATYTFQDIIDPLNRPFTQALSLNNLGEIVGDYVDSGGIMHGFLDNSGALTTLDPTGSTVTTINGINDLVRSSASM